MRKHPSEAQEAEILCQWMTLRRIKFFHVPNEGRRSWVQAKSMKRQGLVPGVPDYCILSKPTREPVSDLPDIMRGEIQVPLWLELKAIDGVTTTSQLEFQIMLRDLGYVVVTCYGADESIEALEQLGY